MAIKLNQREKYYVATAIAAVVVFAVVQLIVYPLLDKRNQLQRTVNAANEQLLTMLRLNEAFKQLQREVQFAKNNMTSREPGFSLFSYLDGLVGKTGLKDRISYMKPSSTDGPEGRFKISSVEMKLQGITLDQLVRYLYQIEYSRKNVQVKRMSISETGKQEALVDVVLQVETLEAA